MEQDRPVSVAEADMEYARAIGAQHPERAWIFSDRDAWYRNLAYVGPAVPHPESLPDEDELTRDLSGQVPNLDVLYPSALVFD